MMMQLIEKFCRSVQKTLSSYLGDRFFDTYVLLKKKKGVRVFSCLEFPNVSFMRLGAHFDTRCMPEDDENGAAEG